jgi:uncharacterized membrane protein
MSQTPAYAGNAPVAENPGKTLGIVALIAAFFVSLLGIILGFVALNQSKKAGYPNGPAKAAIIVGIIITVLWIIGVILFVVLGASLFGAAANQFAQVCAELGAGEHTVDGITYTCPS